MLLNCHVGTDVEEAADNALDLAPAKPVLRHPSPLSVLTATLLA